MVGDELPKVAPCNPELSIGEQRNLAGGQGNAEVRGSVLREMLRRLARFIVVRRAVSIMVMMMVMTDAADVVDLVRNIEHFLECKCAALHGKSMHGEQQHQEDAKETTHGKVSGYSRRGLYQLLVGFNPVTFFSWLCGQNAQTQDARQWNAK